MTSSGRGSSPRWPGRSSGTVEHSLHPAGLCGTASQSPCRVEPQRKSAI